MPQESEFTLAKRANILSGAALKKGSELRGGISVDQAIANAIGGDDIVHKLGARLRTTYNGISRDQFLHGLQFAHIMAECYIPCPDGGVPITRLRRLFENRGSQRNKSVLDRILEDAKDLERDASASDRAKLDEYLTSVREIEKRVERQRNAVEKASDRVQEGKSIATMKRPDNGLPEDIREHMKLMCDIIALAFQTHRTRIASLLLCRDISGYSTPSWMFLSHTILHHTMICPMNGNGLQPIIVPSLHTLHNDWIICKKVTVQC